jgi:hypothetical protein
MVFRINGILTSIAFKRAMGCLSELMATKSELEHWLQQE